MSTYQRIFLIIIDSFGIGEAEDAAAFGDAGADTLGHIAQHHMPLRIPHLCRLGLVQLRPLPQLRSASETIGCAVRLKEASASKDTMSGHWEMMGLPVHTPFRTFTDTGFPQGLIDALSSRCDHRRIIGNKAASGTEILDELGEQELNNGDLIVYTSADSVLQICGNEETMGLPTLYRYCEEARALTMKEEWRVGRVIARPYRGRRRGEFVRTANRHDYALAPYGRTVLDELKENGYDVIGVGKISDIFSGRGITRSIRSASSVEGMRQTIECAKTTFQGLCFVNLVDFDALWGHRRDPLGYGDELERFDVLLGELLQLLRKDDLLMVSADHGNDPTFRGSDHTREDVPLLMYSPSMCVHGLLESGATFADIGVTIAENFQVCMPEGTAGRSRLKVINRRG